MTPYQGQQWQPQQPPRRSRGGWIVALVASLALLVVLVVAIVVVLVERGSDSGNPPAGRLDACLVGHWRQTDFRANVDLSGDDFGEDANLGTVELSGGGREWVIRADGTADENYGQAHYTGTTRDGRRVDVSFTGSNTWTLHTADNTVLMLNETTTVVMEVTVNGVRLGSVTIQPNHKPQPYTCTSGIWRTTSTTDTAAATQYERVS